MKKTPLSLVKKMGGPVAVARALRLRSHTGVYAWKVIPAHHVITLEAQFGIPREELRPDLYRPAVASSVSSAAPHEAAE